MGMRLLEKENLTLVGLQRLERELKEKDLNSQTCGLSGFVFPPEAVCRVRGSSPEVAADPQVPGLLEGLCCHLLVLPGNAR